MLPDFGRLPPARQTLLLVGNAGPELWPACQASGFAGQSDPVDRYSVDSCLKILGSLIEPATYELLYPSIPGQHTPECQLSLQALGEVAGWHQTSPLGIGINEQHGLWFAYRCLVLLDIEPEPEPIRKTDAGVVQPGPDICNNCKTQECLKACPAEALVLDQLPDLQRCIGYRLQTDSECAGQCLARNACPVSPGSRYTAEQINYHYSLSLASIRRYVNQ